MQKPRAGLRIGTPQGFLHGTMPLLRLTPAVIRGGCRPFYV